MKHQVQHKLLSIRRKRKQINEQPELRGIIADPIQSDEFWKDLFLVRPLENAEKGKALQLAWKVFCEFESPDYAPEGTEEFKKRLNDDAYLAGIRYYGAFDEEKLVGMLGIREEKRHVCFFFVDGEYQRLGIGRKLFKLCQIGLLFFQFRLLLRRNRFVIDQFIAYCLDVGSKSVIGILLCLHILFGIGYRLVCRIKSRLIFPRVN